MESLIMTLNIVQSFAIAIGAGTSTLAVVNFFYAIADGKIDETERNFMGITYVVLRVAMAFILITLILLTILGCLSEGAAFFTGYTTAESILVAILFVNSFLMTIRLMPSTFGPAIQASSWYSLAFLQALYTYYQADFSLLVFCFSYLTFLFFAVSLINSIMAYLKDKSTSEKAAENSPS